MAALALLEDIIPLCPKYITCPYSAQEQRNVKENFLRKTGFPMASHPDCAHSDSLGSPLRYSTCQCAVGSGAQHRHTEGKVDACLDASGGRLLYDSEKVCQIILACCVLHNIRLSNGIELGEDKMRMDQDDHPPFPAGWNTHITALRRRELIHQLYQQYKNKCTHVHFLQNVLFRHVCSKNPQ